ncbi:hypothetical protein SAMN05216203_0052 [Marinobacter daqiaonensis]|uniref:DUF2066 domain-containing protein n=1 Tax=Marinobacter daqiaonensis TaxID=650891 RepID=A0A1I6GG18_9GAMM|nr:DUF2066 domain-containing protein [Marinobacter daqiaonensis]SFR41144.1 hypothetical protein SAMN05216203_0052 [Marinobacter daqiaonensis]
MAVTHHWHQLGQRLFLLLATACLALLTAMPAHAVVVDGLFREQVPLTGTDEQALAEGYETALREVLVRVSGNSEVTGLEGIGPVLEDAESLVQSWQVVQGEDGGKALAVTFGQVAVNRALASAGARVWGANRPLTLAWIAVQDRGDRGLLVDPDESSGEGWSAHFQQAAAERGLPLVFPAVEQASDRRLLSEVWGQFMGRISEASQGTSHDLLAVVRINRRNDGWEASWIYEGEGVDQQKSATGASPKELTRTIIDAWTSELADRFAVTASAVATGPVVHIEIADVDSVADYAAIKRALSGLTPVESVGARQVTRQRIVLRVAFTGELDQLRRNIALDDRFLPVAPEPESTDRPGPEAGPGATAEPAQVKTGQDVFQKVDQTLHYRWRGGVIATPSAGE